MNHVHFDDTKENNQVKEAADDSPITSVNESLKRKNVQNCYMITS